MCAYAPTMPGMLLCACLFAAPAQARPSTPPQTPLQEQLGDAPGDQFGFAVAAAGDVDGDGSADFLVGAPLEDDAGIWAGAARVLSGADGSELLLVLGQAPLERLGASVASAGDLNGDGRDDVILGAPNAQGAAGTVRVHAGEGGALLLEFQGASPGDLFGQCVGSLGDVDLDGIPDLLVGSPRNDSAGTDAGSLSVVSGATGSLLLEVLGPAPGDQLGAAAAGVGDLNADGLPDILIGLPRSDAAGVDAGAARLISSADGALLLELLGNDPGERFGAAVAPGGDENADGVQDLVVGAYLAVVGGQAGAGRVRVFDSASGQTIANYKGFDAGQFLGFSLDGGSDANGDGRSDVLVGSHGSDLGRGTSQVIAGLLQAPLLSGKGAAPGDFLGFAVGWMGDADGDGLPESLHGAYGHGDARGRVLVHRGRAESLLGAPAELSLAQGGSQALILRAPPSLGGSPYIMLGSAAGTSPGVSVDGLLLPLNVDSYALYLLSCAGCSPLQNGFSTLNASSEALAKVKLPAGLPPGLAGTQLHHAYLVLGGGLQVSFASAAAGLTLVQ